MKDLNKIAIIFAGGQGLRMNNVIPKQLLKIKNKEIIAHVIEIFERSNYIDKIYISFIPEMITELQKIIKKYGYKKVAGIVKGGSSGQESIYNALKQASKENDSKSIVFIHDGVRPFVSEETIALNYNMVLNCNNAITVTPATETITVIDEQEKIDKIFDRSKCFIAQAPQSFILNDILLAHNKEKKLKTNYKDVIDSSTLFLKHYPNNKLNIVIGDLENIKITKENDLLIADAYFNNSKKFKKESYK